MGQEKSSDDKQYEQARQRYSSAQEDFRTLILQSPINHEKVEIARTELIAAYNLFKLTQNNFSSSRFR